MRIEHLKLTNFRNYSSLDLDFDNNVNIIIGDNGKGKTNVLESIYVLSLTKSNRFGVEENLIKFDEEIAKVEGLIKKDDLIKKQEVQITRRKKQIFINNKEMHRMRDYISNFCVISFTPEDLEIVKGSPNTRRNMINIDISQLQNSYISYLNEYNQIIKIRNEYLKKMNLDGNSDIRYLDVVNQGMIEKGIKIYEYRYNYFKKINEILPKVFKKLSNIDNLQIKYETNVDLDDFDLEKIKKSYENKIKKNFKVELMQGVTLVGPHRDDFSFYLLDKDMKNFASQGQQRLAIIALKISEIYLFKEEKGEYPVLLLDDIFSEIDSRKRNKIISFLLKDIQSIITTTDINDIDDKLIEKARIFKVNNGKVAERGKKNGRRKSNNQL
jgi:DNA replication and repair protein RecF